MLGQYGSFTDMLLDSQVNGGNLQYLVGLGKAACMQNLYDVLIGYYTNAPHEIFHNGSNVCLLWAAVLEAKDEYSVYLADL